MSASTIFLRCLAASLGLVLSACPATGQDAFAVPSESLAEAAPATGPRNLLNADDCEIIAAPSDRPAKLLEGGFDLPADELAEAVYAFKTPVTLRKVRIFINGSDGQNIKSLELLAADSPAGPFTAVARAGDTLNLKLFKTGGWQEFDIEPVTIGHFKIKAVAHNHAWVRVTNDGRDNGLQLVGETASDGAAP